MYVDTSNAIDFYQADSGQLVFLNGFNMACLLSDFSKSPPEQFLDNSDHGGKAHDIKPPLPDFVEGRVLEIEHVHLNHENRKRMPFLNHIPLYTDIVFVELDLYHLMSEATRRKFKADISKRRKRRQSKIQAEKRADRVLKKEEQERINERKAKLQTIDPDDDFFWVAPTVSSPSESLPIMDGANFGPVPGASNSGIYQEDAVSIPGNSVLQPSASIPISSFSFSEACRRGNQIAVTSTEEFPMLTPEAFPTLASPRKSSNGGDTSLTHPVIVRPASKKKKKKSQKLVLFSTGGIREK